MATLTLQIKARTLYSRTFDDTLVDTTGDTVTLIGHGLVNGDLVELSTTGVLPAPLVATRRYYVVGATAALFQLALTAGGSAINISSAAGGGTHTIKKVSVFGDLMASTTTPRAFARAMAAYFKALAGGAQVASVDVQEDCADPSVSTGGTITITHANVSDTDTVTIGNTVITAKTTATDTSVQFQIGADETADATALAAAINANRTLQRLVIATSALGVVTITPRLKGAIGNAITLATSDATAFALVQPTAGDGGPLGAVSTYSYGK